MGIALYPDPSQKERGPGTQFAHALFSQQTLEIIPTIRAMDWSNETENHLCAL